MGNSIQVSNSTDSSVRCKECHVEFRASDVAGKEKCPVCGVSFDNKATAVVEKMSPIRENKESAQSTTSINSWKPAAGISLLVLLAVGFFAAYHLLTIFVVQPIGAVPEGKTLVILRLNKTNFIDSADGMCDRINGGVSLFCRGVMLAAVVKNSQILFRLPYSEALYLISTGGKQYAK